MKKVLGLDLGTTSIGWALVHEATSESEKSEILKMGVRVIPLTTDEQNNFEAGRSITTNAERTLKRGARRNLQRYKLRRKNLISALIKNGIIHNNTIVAEEGKGSTHSLLELRAKAAEEKIPLEDFGRVLLSINKKRGYKSNRKANTEEEGEVVDSMGIAKLLNKNNWTPGQFVHHRLEEGKGSIPEFYRSDLRNEFDRIWRNQSTKYPQIFTDPHRKDLEGKNKKDTVDYFRRKMSITRAEFKGKRQEKLAELYKWRAKAAIEAIEPDIAAEVLVELNNQINSSSDYLGQIGDRSKILAFNNYTVGQYLHKQIKSNPNTRLKNQVFYRQDYEDEFDKIWDTQAKYYPQQLTDELREEIKDVVIFYQRPLKSQKGLISLCEFESEEKEINVNGKTKKQRMGPRVAPKSSPVFQEFKVWQVLNNVEIMVEGDSPRRLTLEEKEKLYDA
ncbi:MAG: type II CRISPR RNA-guided endonuclease Cas9, partial [Saprospirales bacterium]